MELSKPKAVLFDWDNTLVDTWPVIHQALHDTMTHWQMIPWTLDEVKQRVGKSMRDAFPDLFGAQWEEAGEFYIQTYRRYHLEQLQGLPGATAVLRHISDALPYCAVVSNKRGEPLRIETAHIGWDSHFQAIIGADDAPRDKPHPDPALMALEGSGIAPDEEVWFIGDTITDLECAQVCGMTAILYGDVEPDAPGMYRGFPYRHHVRDHTELLALLRNSC